MNVKHEPQKLNVFGLNFTNTNPEEVLDKILTKKCQKSKYICFPSTNIAAKIIQNPEMQDIFNSAWLTLPDGTMTEYYARLKGVKKLKQVSGYWLLDELLKTDLTHYFYGGSEEVLKKMKTRITNEYPNAKILGYKAPPFLKLEEIKNSEEVANDIDDIARTKPRILWIGISNLKQDLLMNSYHGRLDNCILIGVGAVFLYFSGDVKMGPTWIKRLALRWLVRLVQEPRKESKSLPSTFYFIFLMLKELILLPFKKRE